WGESAGPDAGKGKLIHIRSSECVAGFAAAGKHCAVSGDVERSTGPSLAVNPALYISGAHFVRLTDRETCRIPPSPDRRACRDRHSSGCGCCHPCRTTWLGCPLPSARSQGAEPALACPDYRKNTGSETAVFLCPWQHGSRPTNLRASPG